MSEHPERIWMTPLCERCVGSFSGEWAEDPNDLNGDCIDPECEGSRKPQEYIRADVALANEVRKSWPMSRNAVLDEVIASISVTYDGRTNLLPADRLVEDLRKLKTEAPK